MSSGYVLKNMKLIVLVDGVLFENYKHSSFIINKNDASNYYNSWISYNNYFLCCYIM